jgi:hypothetical protein
MEAAYMSINQGTDKEKVGNYSEEYYSVIKKN